MSKAEILEALPRLSFDELQQVHERILDLEGQDELVPSAEFAAAIEEGLRSSDTEPTADADTVRRKLAVWVGRSA